MIDLTETEKLILMKIFSFEFKGVKGVSSLMLEKRGVNRKTFTKHRGVLVKEHLIEEESVKRKTWTYYKTTTLGKAMLFSSRIKSEPFYSQISFFYNYLPKLKNHYNLLEKAGTEDHYDDVSGKTNAVRMALLYAFDFIDVTKFSKVPKLSWWSERHGYEVTIKIPVGGFEEIFSLSYGHDESDIPELSKRIQDFLTFNFLLNLSNMKKYLNLKSSKTITKILKKPDLVKFHKEELTKLVKSNAELTKYCKI